MTKLEITQNDLLGVDPGLLAKAVTKLKKLHQRMSLLVIAMVFLAKAIFIQPLGSFNACFTCFEKTDFPCFWIPFQDVLPLPVPTVRADIQVLASLTWLSSGSLALSYIVH